MPPRRPIKGPPSAATLTTATVLWPYQIVDIHTQHKTQFAKYQQGWVADCALYLTHICAINVRVEGELLL